MTAMQVAIAVHGRYHAFELAMGLHAKGVLSQVATTYPGTVARRFLPDGVRLRCAPWLELWRRAQGWFPEVVPSCDPGLHCAFGRFVQKTLPERADLLVGWSSATLEAIPAAQARGMKVILERGSTHILHQKEVLVEEYGRLGLGAPPMNEQIIERELSEYNIADAIAVPTGYAAETFVARGIPRDRLIVNPYGIDLSAAGPLPQRGRREDHLRCLFVGQVGVRKGVATLLEAFAHLNGGAELHLVGPVEPRFEPALAGSVNDNVIVHGPLSGEALKSAYERADVFCLPSVEEGFGLVLLEAMAVGLPIVTTSVTGGSELIRTGMEGIIVEPGQSDELTEALAVLNSDPRRRDEMGAAGRKRVEDLFTLTHYRDRAIAAYHRLLDVSDQSA